MDDAVNSLSKDQHCVALFLYLSEASHAVNHSILLKRFLSLGFDISANNWLKSHLSDVQLWSLFVSKKVFKWLIKVSQMG